MDELIKLKDLCLDDSSSSSHCNNQSKLENAFQSLKETPTKSNCSTSSQRIPNNSESFGRHKNACSELIIFEALEFTNARFDSKESRKCYYKYARHSVIVCGWTNDVDVKEKISNLLTPLGYYELYLLQHPESLAKDDPIFVEFFSQLEENLVVAVFESEKLALEACRLDVVDKGLKIVPAMNVLPYHSKLKCTIDFNYRSPRVMTPIESPTISLSVPVKEETVEITAPTTPVQKKTPKFQSITSISHRGVSLSGCDQSTRKKPMEFSEIENLAVIVSGWPTDLDVSSKIALLDPFQKVGATVAWVPNQGALNEAALVIFGASSHALRACSTKKLDGRLTAYPVYKASPALRTEIEKMSLRVPGRPQSDTSAASRMITSSLGLRSIEKPKREPNLSKNL